MVADRLIAGTAVQSVLLEGPGSSLSLVNPTQGRFEHLVRYSSEDALEAVLFNGDEQQLEVNCLSGR